MRRSSSSISVCRHRGGLDVLGGLGLHGYRQLGLGWWGFPAIALAPLELRRRFIVRLFGHVLELREDTCADPMFGLLSNPATTPTHTSCTGIPTTRRSSPKRPSPSRAPAGL